MRRLVYLHSAERDLSSILTYIGRQSRSRAVARQFHERLKKQCAKLASSPGMLGEARPDLAPGLRRIPFRGYLIFFRYRDDALEIVNLLEGHRDIDAHFSGPSGTDSPDP